MALVANCADREPDFSWGQIGDSPSHVIQFDVQHALYVLIDSEPARKIIVGQRVAPVNTILDANL